MNFAIPFLRNSLILGLFLVVNQILIAANDDSTKHYLLIINARGTDLAMGSKTFSLTGHAFVSWATQMGQDSIITQKTAGFYPNKKASWVNMMLDTLEGHINDNFEANSNDFNVPVEQIIIEVDSMSWVASQQVEKKYKKKSYNLFKFNCVNFVNKVVTAARLKRAKTKHFSFIPVSPLQYLNRISDLNRDKVVQTKSLRKMPKEVVSDRLIAKAAQELSKNAIAQH
jgi:hypothetical protein